MSAYIVAFVEMLDEEKFRAYQGVASEIFERYGARFLTRGGAQSVLEGPDEGRTCVVVEFPSAEKATEFWNSPDYQAAIKLRDGAAEMQAILLDGGD